MEKYSHVGSCWTLMNEYYKHIIIFFYSLAYHNFHTYKITDINNNNKMCIANMRKKILSNTRTLKLSDDYDL